MVRPRKSVLLSVVLVAVLAMEGCGYSIHRHASLPIKEISIGLIENKTVEPKVEDKLHRALAEECFRQGIAVRKDAAVKLFGIITRFQMTMLSQKAGLAAEYQVSVDADFTLTRPDGTTEHLGKIESPFIVPFSSSEDLAALLAGKDAVEERAMRDIAVKVIGSLIYK